MGVLGSSGDGRRRPHRGGARPAVVVSHRGGTSVEEREGGQALELQWGEAELLVGFEWAMRGWEQAGHGEL